MPKKETDYPETINFRVSKKSKSDLLLINSTYSDPAREAIEQFIPIKKLLVNPLAIPRSINKNDNIIELSSSVDGMFIIIINGEKISLNREDVNFLLANIFLFTINTPES